MSIKHGVVVALVLAGALGCAGDDEGGEMLVLRGPEALRTGEQQLDRLCSRGAVDRVIDLFCTGRPPEVTSLEDVRALLRLDSDDNVPGRGFALTGNSTSLVSHIVSSINPRAVFVRNDPGNDFVALAFTRGEQFTEIVVRDRLTEELQFYLGTFTLPCSDTEQGCLPADLLTEDFESGWTAFNMYAEEDVRNSPLDCRVCHQPNGPDSPKLLRMQEFDPPWNHWFYRLSTGGRALLADYYAAKGDEPFAGVPAEAIEESQPGLLSSTIFFAGTAYQPNAFESAAIEREVIESAAKRGGQQPEDNSVPGESETWNAIYEHAKNGEAISVPYHDVKVTDPDKLAAMTQAYTDYREGRLAREALPDIRDVYPDDPELLARMGFTTEPGLDGEGVLLQACGQCHNSRLDQSVTRARFNVDLRMMSREEKDRAIARVSLPIDDPSVMPPRLFRRLDDQARKRLIELLER